MRVTTDHAASSYGVPVILDDDGQVVDSGPGIKAALERLGMSRAEFAASCGVSVRTVEDWIYGRSTSAAALNVLAALLKQSRRRGGRS